MGVRLDEEFDVPAAKRLRLTRLYGARVVEVYGDTPAEVAGLQIDDVVLTFDGQEIEDQSHLIHLVSLTPVNKVVRMSVLRAGSRITVDVRLTERRPSQTSQSEPSPFKMNSFSEKKARQSGLTVVTLDDSLAVQVGNRIGTRGVLVTRCDNTENPDSLQLYDVIEEAARQPVSEPIDLDRILSENDGPVLLKVLRTVDGQSQSRLILWPAGTNPKSD